MKFIPTDYTERHVIHCPSKEAWDKVVEVLDSHGLITAAGNSFRNWEWGINNCIRFMVGRHDKRSTYSSDPELYTILEYDDFEWEEQEPFEIEFGIAELFE